MKVWAISDPHLCTTNPEKDMSVFGDNWIDHGTKIYNNWQSVVGDDDIVLVPGDICWAMRLPDGIKELEFLSSLPGEKVFTKGNHDYWWDSINKVRKNAPSRMHFIQNDSVVIGDYGFAGTRLWDYEFVKWPCVFVGREDQIPETKDVSENWLSKVRNREARRLENSLESLPKVQHRIVLTHFPPIDENGEGNFITDMLSKHNVETCVFGHIHSAQGSPVGADCTIGNTRYVLTAADWIDFMPKEITL